MKLNVTTDDGQYTVIMEDNGALRALRHNEEWRECSGDNLIYMLASNLQDARDKIKNDEEIKSKLMRIAYLSYHKMGNNLSQEEYSELSTLLVQFTMYKHGLNTKEQQKP